MARSLVLESFGQRAAVKKVPPPPPQQPEDTELFRRGKAAGASEGYERGYAAGALAAGAELKAVLALAADAIDRASQDRAAMEARLSAGVGGVVRALATTLAPQLCARGFLDEAIAVLNDWVGGAIAGRGVVYAAPSTHAVLADACAGHPDLAGLEVRPSAELEQYQLRFEWRDGVGEFDLNGAADAALAAIDRKLAGAGDETERGASQNSD